MNEYYVVCEETLEDGLLPVLVTDSLDSALERMRRSYEEFRRMPGYEETDDVQWEPPAVNQRLWKWYYNNETYSCEVHAVDLDGCPSGGCAYVALSGDSIREFHDMRATRGEAFEDLYWSLANHIESCDGNASGVEFFGSRERPHWGWYASGDGTTGYAVYEMPVEHRAADDSHGRAQ